ncbi:MAG: purine-nucleoside phosphorylase, partial [Micrococcales bacterium]|nr:purine-nucleoside phosphorylase [Micrococcales bacterium]
MDDGGLESELAERAGRWLVRRTGVERYDAAVVLGSGWALAADGLGQTLATVPADEVPGFVASPVAGHTGTLRAVRTAGGRVVLVVGARTHLYQGL